MGLKVSCVPVMGVVLSSCLSTYSLRLAPSYTHATWCHLFPRTCNGTCTEHHRHFSVTADSGFFIVCFIHSNISHLRTTIKAIEQKHQNDNGGDLLRYMNRFVLLGYCKKTVHLTSAKHRALN